MPAIGQAENIVTEPNFERNFYEAFRRETLAPAVGGTALRGVEVDSLPGLEKRRREEVISALAEGLKPDNVRGVINTHYVFEKRDDKLVAADGEDIEQMLVRAFHEDIKLANKDKFFAPFLPRRSRAELDEHREQQSIARGEADYNTIVAFSAYGEEYDDGSKTAQSKLIRAGQKPYWQRAMLRVSHWDGEKLHIFSRSVDNSDLELLKQTAKNSLDYDFAAEDSTAMLEERVHLRVGDDSWRRLADELVEAADDVLAKKFGGSWKQGNPEHNVRQAQAYVESQTEIIEGLLGADKRFAAKHGDFEDYKKAFERQLYNTIALLETRLERGVTERVVDYESASGAAGALASAQGKTYDMCGITVSGGDRYSPGAAQQSGSESLMRLENKKVNCPDCRRNVIVDKSYLEKGQLHCKECGYMVDVCTGRTSRELKRSPAAGSVSVFDILGSWWRKQTYEDNIRSLRKKYEDTGNRMEAKKIEQLISEQTELQKAA